MQKIERNVRQCQGSSKARARRTGASVQRAAAMVVGLVLAVTGDAGAQTSEYHQLWPEVKCERYTKAWTEALGRRGQRGLGEAFLERHAAFLASGCTARADVCPRSAEELELANIMVIRAMNAGMASTFLPFACRKPD